MRISDWSSDVCSSDLLLWDGKLPFQSSLSRSDGEVAARSADGGAMARGRCPSTIACGDGPPPHRFATGRMGRPLPAPSGREPTLKSKTSSRRSKILRNSAETAGRSEERRVGKERVSTCRQQRRTDHLKKKKTK